MNKMAVCNRLAASWAGWRALALINTIPYNIRLIQAKTDRYIGYNELREY